MTLASEGHRGVAEPRSGIGHPDPHVPACSLDLGRLCAVLEFQQNTLDIFIGGCTISLVDMMGMRSRAGAGPQETSRLTRTIMVLPKANRAAAI